MQIKNKYIRDYLQAYTFSDLFYVLLALWCPGRVSNKDAYYIVLPGLLYVQFYAQSAVLSMGMQL